MKRSEKKRKQKKVVLMFTLATAAVIVGGMTFAWYNAQDEVTNRFSASANFGASLVEEFAPPTDWQPGAKTEKKVSVVNTGTVDAFTRAWLTAEMRVVSADKEGSALTTASAAVAENPRYKTGATNAEKMGLVETATAGTFLKVLDNSAVANPGVNAGSGTALNEVQAVQAGGYLAYAPDANAKWYYVDGDNIVLGGTHTDEEIDAIKTATGKSNVSVTLDTSNQFKGHEIDAASFVPETDGLYLFRRNITIADNDTDSACEYSGYYFKKGTSGTSVDTYYALLTINGKVDTDTADSDIAVAGIENGDDGILDAAGDVAGVKLFAAKYNLYANDDLTWEEGTAADKTNGLTDYDTSTDKFLVVSPSGSNVKAFIKLANIDNAPATATSETWTKLGTAKDSVFYYNDDLESGATTTNFVEEVQLNKKLNQDDFLTFDFDLNVHMDSVQVTNDTDGKELTTSAVSAFANGAKTNITSATATYETTPTTEIDFVTWGNTTP